MAIGGSSFAEMEYILRYYLSRNRAPHLIVYGLSINRYSDRMKMRPSVYLMLPDSLQDRFDAFLETHERPHEPEIHVLNRLPAFQYRKVVQHLAKYLVQGSIRLPEWTQGHLQVRFSGNVPDQIPPHEAGIDEIAFRSFVRYCDSEGITLAFIEPPNSEVYNRTTIGRDEVLAVVEQVIGERYAFQSYNEDVSMFPAREWSGMNHFNREGAVRFSRLLAPFILENLPG